MGIGLAVGAALAVVTAMVVAPLLPGSARGATSESTQAGHVEKPRLADQLGMP
jgi:hypothetical protein